MIHLRKHLILFRLTKGINQLSHHPTNRRGKSNYSTNYHNHKAKSKHNYHSPTKKIHQNIWHKSSLNISKTESHTTTTFNYTNITKRSRSKLIREAAADNICMTIPIMFFFNMLFLPKSIFYLPLQC